ncbi:MAG: phosphoribosylformylglycinamidine synthase subunit PurS [Candidatus Ratteibacteria bacterium]|nr:phosphoribosylformylglycinamidine synthase subunit PurS [Candidatus Ratteibacteria bacterium]
MKENKFLIEVCNKEGVPDIFGMDALKNIRETGLVGIEDIATADLYRFEGDISLEDIRKIAEDVLLDRVIQRYFIREEGTPVRKDGYSIVVDVFYKKGVTDAVADTVSIAIRDAGIKADVKTSTGKRYYIKGRLTKHNIELICEKVLANRLVQDYSIRLLNEEGYNG